MGLFESDNSMSDMLSQLEKNKSLYNGIALPKYAEFNPELYNNEAATATLTNEDPTVKSRQLEALSKLSDLSSEGLSDADVAAFDKARRVGNDVAKSGTQGALANAAARGIGGSGLEFAMREGAGQDASERAQEAGLAKAAAAANQRAQYLQAYSQQMGGVRDQDYRANSGNTNVINQFNQANTQGRNVAANANVGARNDAFQYNQNLKDKEYQNQIGQADRIAGINTKQGEMSAAEKEAERRRSAALTGVVGAGIGGAIGGPAGASVGYGVGSSVY